MNTNNNQNKGTVDNITSGISSIKIIKIGILAVTSVSLFLSIFLVAQTFVTINRDDNQSVNILTVMGEGEIMAVPDTAIFNYTVSEVAETVAAAQNVVTNKNNEILDLLKKEGISEKDIKTKSYNIYPKYEWQTEVCFPGEYCRGGKNTLIGQEVSQTIEVVIREMDKAGKLLSVVGQKEVENLSGLSFKIDNEEGVKDEARGLAIKDAKKKAERLEKDLGVKLKKIISFNEEQNNIYALRGGAKGMSDSMMMSAGEIASPEVPAGENEIKIKVFITYEIKN